MTSLLDPVVLTARAENFLHGRPDLDDTIARLQAYAGAGADVVYAPGLTDIEQVRAFLAYGGAVDAARAFADGRLDWLPAARQGSAAVRALLAPDG